MYYIYRLTFIKDGSTYIGRTQNVEQRIQEHYNKIMWRGRMAKYNKYDPPFVHEVIDHALTREDAAALEKAYIQAEGPNVRNIIHRERRHA